MKHEDEIKQKEEKDLKAKLLLELNEKIRKENDKFKLESPFKHKYGWGADQTRVITLFD